MYQLFDIPKKVKYDIYKNTFISHKNKPIDKYQFYMILKYEKSLSPLPPAIDPDQFKIYNLNDRINL